MGLTKGRKHSARCRITSNTSFVHATATVLQVSTVHDAGHLRPDDDRREHSARRNVTRKTRNVPLPLSTTSAGTQRARGGPRRPPLPPLLPLPPPLLFPHGSPRREFPHRAARDLVPEKGTTRGARRHGPAARVLLLLLDQGLRVILKLRRLVRSIQVLLSRPRP